MQIINITQTLVTYAFVAPPPPPPRHKSYGKKTPSPQRMQLGEKNVQTGSISIRRLLRNNRRHNGRRYNGPRKDSNQIASSSGQRFVVRDTHNHNMFFHSFLVTICGPWRWNWLKFKNLCSMSSSFWFWGIWCIYFFSIFFYYLECPM